MGMLGTCKEGPSLGGELENTEKQVGLCIASSLQCPKSLCCAG